MTKAPRIRIDELLAKLGHAESRSRAQRMVMAGSVRINGVVAHKSSVLASETDTIEVEQPPRFVSRGGDKLANGIDDLAGQIADHGFAVAGARAIDIGASTGGFTDCLLQAGAAAVIAVDVGYGQLHPRIREDGRVTVMERTNARHLTLGALPFAPDMIVCDASFIALATVLPAPLSCMSPGYWGLILCKPQFEAGKERMRKIGKGGVIRDAVARDEIVGVTQGALEGLGVDVLATVPARPPGPKGNIEYVMLVRDGRSTA